MLKVALTGGIATGKSYVLARLKDRGIPVIDADAIVHEALGPGTPTSRAVAAQFGRVLLTPEQGVDRALLGAKVFGDPDARRRLEAIVHPVVWDVIARWYDGLDRPMGVASIPLLYETGHEGDFDFVVATVCPVETQLQRIVERDRLPMEEALRRVSAQMPAAEKASRANFVIDTAGTRQATDRQVDELVNTLTST